MKYPSKSDIITAVKYPQFIKDSVVHGGEINIVKAGRPEMYTGGFSIVFPIFKNNIKYAFRVWHIQLTNVKDRYIEISNYLSKVNLKYFADFSFVKGGLLVNGQLIDTTRMKWVEGEVLKEYLNSNLNNKQKIIKLSEDFLSMTQELHLKSISHGDLQHGNIIIDRYGEIQLVDYDSVYVPNLKGKAEIITGLKGYQHPARFTNKITTAKADYFSELIIYISILALTENPSLWDKYHVRDSEVLLFKHEDFLNFDNSKIKSDLEKLSPKINALVKVLDVYLKEDDINKLSPFSDVLEALFKDPQIIFFSCDKAILDNSPDKTITIKWKTAFVNNVDISKVGNGLVFEGEKQVAISKESIITITASNALGKVVTDTLVIKVSKEEPKIVVFELSKDMLTDKTPSVLSWDIQGAETINITNVGKNLPLKQKRDFFSVKDTTVILEAYSYFGVKIKREIYLKVSKDAPKIYAFYTNYQYVLPNTDINIHWQVNGADTIEIYDETENIITLTREQSNNTQYRVTHNKLLKLKATSLFGVITEQYYRVNILPMPIIEAINVGTPPVEFQTNINFDNLGFPDGLIDTNNFQLDIPIAFDDLSISFQKNYVKIDNLELMGYKDKLEQIEDPTFILENRLLSEIDMQSKGIYDIIMDSVKSILDK